MRLTKWYFDFLTARGDFLFVYLATARCAGVTLRSLTIHLARPETGTSLTRSLPLPDDALVSEPSAGFGPDSPDDDPARATSPFLLKSSKGEIRREEPAPGLTRSSLPLPRIECDGEHFMLDFADRDCAVHLRYELARKLDFQPVVIRTGAESSIFWKPLGLRFLVSGSVAMANEKLELDGASGYVDFLQSTCVPMFNPVRGLHWGRLSYDGIDLVYMRAAAADGSSLCSRLYGRWGEQAFEGQDLAFEGLDGRGPGGTGDLASSCYAFSAPTKTGAVRLQVRRGVPVQRGSFIDQQRHSSPLTRSLLKWVTRNPRGTKFLSHGRVSFEQSGQAYTREDIPLIDEQVSL